MDININVRIDSPDIMNSLLALSEALAQIKTAAEIKGQTQIKPEEVQAPKEKNKVVTLEEVRGLLAKLSQAGKQQKVKALIEKFGGKRLSDIPKQKYGELLKEAEAI
ncbi:rRNA biogenesis protein rrp5 [Clostridium carboxidivorans P7]|uniref:rRNA biogenesis protein rrp5, putative n=1 Tax=Clostridium carboxidivorans P7 TaxID=536227 RepID=C6PV65_9CLOT|nr:hypothetical protein [Clostridium carboxidivorans]AKN33787.1 rRNA biogenesis protein rrp5 [Clostridium carboxidivorans P7]EET86883.1 rRNA biogenesis protein rrp5, putative [Clostridium carboxidivorans P7]EFG86604.1 hypothetical protein CLCAR_3551 [Clostridium carboxidivorans P7]